MTIKVIKSGLKKEHWKTTYRASCFRCKCVFACDQTDGRYVSPHLRNEGDFVVIKCPNCQNYCHAYPSVLDV